RRGGGRARRQRAGAGVGCPAAGGAGWRPTPRGTVWRRTRVPRGGLGGGLPAAEASPSGGPMTASLNRRLLQVTAGLSAIHFLTGGGCYLWRGVAGLSLFTPAPLPIAADPSWANVDYMFLALAGIWFGLGVMLADVVPSIERRS